MEVQLTQAIVQALAACGFGVLTEAQDSGARGRRIGDTIQAKNPDGTPKLLFVFGSQFQPDGRTFVIVGNGRSTRLSI